MGFNKTVLKNDFKAIFNKANKENNYETVAEDMANAIDKFVKTGKATGVDSRGDTHNLTLN